MFKPKLSAKQVRKLAHQQNGQAAFNAYRHNSNYDFTHQALTKKHGYNSPAYKALVADVVAQALALKVNKDFDAAVAAYAASKA